MKDFIQSASHAIRVLAKNPGFTLSALAILTLGIGANTAIFSVVNTVLLRPLPFPQSDAIVTVFHTPPQSAFPGIKRFAVSAANYIDWRNQNDVFETMSVVSGRTLQLGGGSRPQPVIVTTSDAGFFKVLRAKPMLGRAFTESETVPGQDDVIVLSHALAETRFGSPGKAMDQNVELSGRKYRVIGIMPPEFQVQSFQPLAAQGWIPLAWTPADRAVRGNHNVLVIARLKEGISVEKAQSSMDVLSDRLARQYPEENQGWGAIVKTLRNDLVGDVRPALLTLLGAVGFVLLIACANTANLVLARTIGRRKELAIRAALGAGTRDLLRPVLLETTLLALIGGALGLIVARAGQSLITRALAGQLPRATEVQMDAGVLVFTLATSLLTGLTAGLIAGVKLTRGDVNESLKLGFGRSDSYSGGRRTRTALVVSEVALSLMLLIGAGLMIRSLGALRGTDPGFNAANLLTMDMQTPRSSEKAARSRFYDEFLPRVAALPGIQSVAAIDDLPMQGGSEQPIVPEGRPAEVFALQRNVSVRRTTPNYFRTMGIRILKGRDFTLADTSGGASVAVVSQSMADLFWPGENPIGKRFRISFTPEIMREVVGVVNDIRQRGLDVLEPVTMLYLPILQSDSMSLSLVVRGNVVRGNKADVASLTPGIANALSAIDSEIPLRNIRTMEELIAVTLSQARFSMWLFVALAGLAFLLASVGIYSVLAYGVRSRVREIGVRMALGARPVDVLRLVVSDGMRPTFLGLAIGAFGAYALGGVLSTLIYGVSATDPLTFLSVALLLAAVALMACAVPAYRAARVRPVEALRTE